jgi:hypothetical protein
MTNGRLIDIKQKANNEAKQLMKAILNESKLIPYDQCIDPRLKNFTNKAYVKDVCYDIFGENKEMRCEEKANFCEMCCHFHVGNKFYIKKRDCETRCTNLINGRNPEKKLNKSLRKGKGKGKGKKKGKGEDDL